MAELSKSAAFSEGVGRIGRRIIIYGPTGSGKTTVARQIGDVLGQPIVELDALFHGPNWKPTPEDEFRVKVREALDGHDGGWVCDGNYTSFVRDITIPIADTVVWLRLPFRVTYWRLLKRTITRFWTRELLWGTNRESFRKSFLSRDSILLWGITDRRQHFKDIQQALNEIPHQAVVLQLLSAGAVEEFLASLEATRRP